MSLIVASLLAYQLLSSASIPHLQPRVVTSGEGIRDLLLSAPEIVMVTVISTTPSGPVVEITPNELAIRLIAVDCYIETSIRGALMPGISRFFFFSDISDIGYFHPMTPGQPGKRFVLFLRHDDGVLRTMTDVVTGSVEIKSGRQQPLRPSPEPHGGYDLGAVIAFHALRPAVGEREEGFPEAIPGIVDRLLSITTPGRIAPALRALLTDNDPLVRQFACLTLATGYVYRDTCLLRLLKSDNDAIKRQARIWVPRKAADSGMILRKLREDPMGLSTSRSVDDQLAELELLTGDWDQKVRRQACAQLARLFPIRNFVPCRQM